MANWNQIVEQFGRRMLVLAQRILGNSADAEEVVQEALFEAYKFAQNASVDNWPALLNRLTTHRSLDRLRQRRPLEMLDPTVADRVDDPHQIAVAHELAERLRDAITQLPRQQGAAFCLRYFDELTYDEIAATLAIDNGAAATAIYKARQRLKLLLEMTAKEASP